MSSSTTITKTISQRSDRGERGARCGREPETEAAQPRQDALRAHRRESRPHLPEIIAGLAEAGIEAERKSVYRDLDALRDFGLDIAKLPTHPVSYASSRAPSPPPSSCCSPTPCSPRASSRFVWPIASPKGWRLWLLPPRRRAFQERARGRPHQDAERIGVPSRGHLARGHPPPPAGAFRYVKHDVNKRPPAPRGRPHLLRDAGMPHLLRGVLLPHRLQREARLLPQLPCRSHAGAAHHRRGACAASASPTFECSGPTLLARSPCSAARRRRRRCSWRNRS